MAKFIIKLSGFLLILLVILGCLLTILPNNKDSYLYEIQNKITRLDTLSSPRLIYVGGSNVGFSIDSKTIADSLHLNVVNMGLHASIGLRYMIDSMVPYLKEGDIVVIMPEFSQFYSQYNGTWEALPVTFFYAPKKDISILNFEQLMSIISGVPSVITSNYNYYISEKPDTNKMRVYSSSGFNTYGDEIAHRNEESRKFNNYEPITTEINEYALDDLSSKIKKLQKTGCKVLLFWPNTIESNYQAQSKAIEDIVKGLGERNLSFSVPPYYFVQPDTMAFDTPYHLNKEASYESSRRFIKAIRKIYPELK